MVSMSRRTSTKGLCHKLINEIPFGADLDELEQWFAERTDAEFDVVCVGAAVAFAVESCEDGSSLGISQFQRLLTVIQDRYRAMAGDIPGGWGRK